MGVRQDVKCSFCGADINRVTWNYGMNRPIAEFFCDNECKGSWQRLQRENLGYTREWLVCEYVEKSRSTYDIAREIGRDPKRVWEWLRDYGIEIRPRGHNTEHLEKYRHVGHPHSSESKEKMRQARLRDGHVPYLKNGVHWMKEDGAVHPNWKGGISPDRQALYASTEWCESVKAVWKRDDAVCQRCGKHHNETENRGTFHIHHIDSFMIEERRTDIDNLVLLCRDCHLWTHSKANKNGMLLGRGHDR